MNPIPRLNDPKWQGIAGYIALIALAATFLAPVWQPWLSPTPQQAKLEIRTLASFNQFSPIDSSASSAIQLQVRGKTEPGYRFTSHWMKISNPGNRSISPSDFNEPIRVFVNPPKQILVLQHVSAPKGSQQLSWKFPGTNAAELTPSLLNPGDEFSFQVITYNPEQAAPIQPDPAELSWYLRIRDVVPEFTIGMQTDPNSNLTPNGIGSIYILHSTSRIAFILFAFACMMFVQIQMALRIQMVSAQAQTFKLLAISLLSICSSEILVDVIGNSRTQPAISPIILIAHGVLIYRLVRKVRQKKEGAENGEER